MQDHVISSMIDGIRTQLVLDDRAVDYVCLGYWVSPYSVPHWYVRIKESYRTHEFKGETAGEAISLARDWADNLVTEEQRLAECLGIPLPSAEPLPVTN